MIKLADGIRHGFQCRIVIGKCRVVATVFLLRTALEAGCVKCVHVTKTVGPGHLITVDTDEFSVNRVFVRKRVSIRPFTRYVFSDVCRVRIVKRIGMVCYCKEVQIADFGGSVDKGIFAATLSVGIIGVRMQLSEINIVFFVLSFRKGNRNRFAVQIILFDCFHLILNRQIREHHASFTCLCPVGTLVRRHQNRGVLRRATEQNRCTFGNGTALG